MSKLKKCVVATAAMNDDIGGESGGGDGGCYLVKAASLDLDKNDGSKMQASTKRLVGVHSENGNGKLGWQHQIKTSNFYTCTSRLY